MPALSLGPQADEVIDLALRLDPSGLAQQGGLAEITEQEAGDVRVARVAGSGCEAKDVGPPRIVGRAELEQPCRAQNGEVAVVPSSRGIPSPDELGDVLLGRDDLRERRA